MSKYETTGLTITEDHKYALNSRPMIGVTTLIQLEGGYPEAEWIEPKYLKRGMDIHIITQLYDLGFLDESVVESDLRGYLESWKVYRDHEGISYDADHIEVKLSDPVYGYCGTLDRLPLLDIKSGAYKKADLAQIGAYYGLCQANKIPLDLWKLGRVIYLDEAGNMPKVHVYGVIELMRARDSFMCALNWYNFKNSK